MRKASTGTPLILRLRRAAKGKFSFDQASGSSAIFWMVARALGPHTPKQPYFVVVSVTVTLAPRSCAMRWTHTMSR